jgi:hypothetical protein
LLTLPVAAALIAVPGQLAILLAAPFARSQRLCSALSEFVLFEFFTVSRSLTLGAACVFLALALWRRGHWAWPFIVLLPQCDFLFGVLSFIFVGWRWAERRAPLGWWAGGSPRACCSMVGAPCADVAPAITQPGRLARLIDWLADERAGLPLQWHGLRPEWGQPPPALLGAIALFAVAAMAWHSCAADRPIARAGRLCRIYASVQRGGLRPSVRHSCSARCCWWRWSGARPAGGRPGVWMRAWLWLVAGCGVFMAVVALIMPFNNSDRASAWIASHNLSQERWLAFPESAGERG